VSEQKPWPTNPWDMQAYPSRLVFGRAVGPDGVPRMIVEAQFGPASVKAIITAAEAANWLAEFNIQLEELRRTPIVRRPSLLLPNGQPPPSREGT
jgi:hypothetical protein